MSRKALYRTNDGVLLAHGFVAFIPEPGEAVEDVPDEFDCKPGLMQRTGPGQWQEYEPPAPTNTERLEQQCPSNGERKVLFEVILELSNQIRDLRTKMNAELVARGQLAAYPNNATIGGAAQITPIQLRTWLESKLP